MAKEQEPLSEVDWEKVARNEIHPRRYGLLQILSLDGGRTLSPKECSYELHTSVSDVNYHMKRLQRTGIVRLAHTIPVRGTFEHFYCLVRHPAIDLYERLGLPKKKG